MKIYILVVIIFLLLINCHKKGGEESEPPKKQPGTESFISSLPDKIKDIVGTEFGPDSIPLGFTEQTGYVMGYLEGDEYVIDHMSNDSLQLLWFCKLTGRDSVGRPFLKILDILMLPEIKQGEELLMGTCKSAEEFDPEIVAIVKFIESEVKSEIIQAWRANRNLKKFEVIPAKNVTCLNESYYL